MSNRTDRAEQELRKEGPLGQRQYSGPMRKAISVYCVLVALYHISYVSGLLNRMGIWEPAVLHRALSLTLLTALVYLLYPAHKTAPRNRLPWYDAILVIMVFVAIGFAVYGYDHLQKLIMRGSVDTTTTVMAWVTILLVLEGGRRVLGLPMPLLVVLFLLQTMFSNYLPGILEGRGYGFDRIAMDLFVFGDQGLFGFAMDAGSTMIIMFIIFSQFLQQSGAGKFMIDASLALLGHVRGGPAKAAVVASALFGTMSGSTLANVVATGTITIPLMKSVGYKAHVAAAVEAVASNGGQIMPPVMGIVAFLIAEWLEMPYYQVCLAALVPALLYFLATFVMVDFEAAKTGLRGLPRQQLPSLRKTVKGGWYYSLPVIALIYFIGVAQDPPARAALYSSIILLLILFIANMLGKKEARVGPRMIAQSLEIGTKSSLQVIMACAKAGILIGAIGITNLGVRLSAFLIDIAGGNMLILLFLTALVAYIMGMGTSSIAIYVMLVLLIAPALVQMGVVPIAAHLFVFYWGLTAMITPPVCIAAYAAASISGANAFRVGFTAMRLSVVLYVIPFMFVYFPALVFQGTPSDIAIAAITAIVGTSAIAAGLAGYLFKKANWLERILFIAGGAGLITAYVPAEIIGTSILAISTLIHWRRKGAGELAASAVSP